MFWSFFQPTSLTAQSLASISSGELQGLVGHDSDKLIAQTYDGAAALSGIRNGVQALFKAVYPKAHFIHCYAHQLNLILRKATSANSKVRIFFNSLSGIPPFFQNLRKEWLLWSKLLDVGYRHRLVLGTIFRVAL